MSFLFGGLSDTEGKNLDYPLTFVGSFRPSGLRLVDGRETDPANEHEFVATRNFVERSQLKIGDDLNLVTLTPEQARENGYVLTDPQGPRLLIKMVGIVDGASQLDNGTPLIFISPALFGENIGLSETLINVDLRPGVDLPKLRADLDADPALAALSLEPGTLVSQAARRREGPSKWSVDPGGSRRHRRHRRARPGDDPPGAADDERERLSAIGFTHSQILAEASARAIIPITIGSLLGSVVAVLGSRQFPFGFVSRPRAASRHSCGLAHRARLCRVFVVALTLWTVGALAVSGRQSRAVVLRRWSRRWRRGAAVRLQGSA